MTPPAAAAAMLRSAVLVALVFGARSSGIAAPGVSLAAMQRELGDLLASQDNMPELPTIVLAGHHNDGKARCSRRCLACA